MKLWRREFRPILEVGQSPFLLPGATGPDKPVTPQALRDGIKAVTKAHIGVTLSPHQFRHLAAKQFLREYPGHYEDVRLMLGHVSTETTIRHYSGAEGTEAHKRHADLMQKKSKLLRSKQPPARGR